MRYMVYVSIQIVKKMTSGAPVTKKDDLIDHWDYILDMYS